MIKAHILKDKLFNFTDAKTAFTNLVQLHPGSSYLKYQLALVYLECGEFYRSSEILSQLLFSDPTSLLGLDLLAWIYFKFMPNSRHQALIDLSQRLLVLHSGTPESWFVYALVIRLSPKLAISQFKSCEDTLNYVREAYPDYSPAPNVLATLIIECKTDDNTKSSFIRAYHLFKAATASFPTSFSRTEGIVTCLYSLSEVNKAKKFVKNVHKNAVIAAHPLFKILRSSLTYAHGIPETAQQAKEALSRVVTESEATELTCLIDSF